MKAGSKKIGGMLFLLGLVTSLPAQTESIAKTNPTDPLVIAARLSRDLEGTPDTKDRTLTLDECLTRVFAENPRVQQEKAAIENALGEKLVYRSVVFPVIKTEILAGQQGPRSQTEARNFALLSGSLNQPLFEASIPASFRRGDIGVVVAQQQFQYRVVTILHQTRLLYYQALHERATLAILNEIQKPLDENIKFEKDRLASGFSARSSVIQAEIRRLQLVPAREASLQLYHESLGMLAEKMGMNLMDPAAVQFWPQGPLPFLPTTFSLKAMTEEALKNRPDLQLMRSLIRQTEEDRRIVQGGYYPKVNLIANGQYLPQTILADSNSSRPGQDTRSTEVLVGPAYTWKIIDTGEVGGAALSLQAAKESYEIQLKDLEQDVPRNLSEIYRALDLSQKRISALADSVKVSEENLKNIADLISLNQASQLDFLNARNSLLQTKQGMLNAFYDNSIALADLDLATGRYLRYVDFEDRKK